jgi:fructokinase
MKLFGGIEAGGTKFVCAVGSANGDIQDKIVIPTTTVTETMSQVIEYFKKAHKNQPLSAIGIASFGPIELNRDSLHYGYITTAPKTGWNYFDFLGTMYNSFALPLGWDTDVNSAALGEYRFGTAKNLDTFIYITVGTGIGAGGMVSGKLMHGLTHPEMGHIFIPYDDKKDKFVGVCPFHGNCLEGLASGPAIKKRWKVDTALDLPPQHPAWDLEADYLAAAFANYILILSTQMIIVGGGVMKQKELLPKICTRVKTLLNGYIKHEKIIAKIDDYIVQPGLGEQSGICGALVLAETAYLESKNINIH